MQPCCTVREVTVCVTVHCDATREWGGNELTNYASPWVASLLSCPNRPHPTAVPRTSLWTTRWTTATCAPAVVVWHDNYATTQGIFLHAHLALGWLGQSKKKKTGAPVFFSRIDRSAHHQTHEVAECTKVPWADSRLPDSTSSLPCARSVIYSRYLPTYISYSGR